LRYRVVIDASAAVRDVLETSVDLIRWQSYEEMSPSLFDALVRQASDQAKEAAATEGFFSANVNVAVDRTTTPWQVKVSVTPGPQARVERASIDIQGAATTDRPGNILPRLSRRPGSSGAVW